MEKKIGLVVLCFSMVVTAGYPESLWPPDFRGFLSETARWRSGDIVYIILDAETELTISSSRSDSKQITLDFTGGPGGDLFAFLPDIRTSGNQSMSDNHQVSLSARLAARIVDPDGSGTAQLRGTRLVSVDGATERVEVSGTILLKEIGKDGSIPFSKVADGRITYQGFLSGDDVIDPDDLMLREPILEFDEPEEGAEPVADRGEARGMLALTEERRNELLLRYINRFMDVIFPAR